MRDMAGKWSDEEVAATLNRMGFTTGQRNTWTGKRVSSHRRNHDIRATNPEQGRWLPHDVRGGQQLGVSRYPIRS